MQSILQHRRLRTVAKQDIDRLHGNVESAATSHTTTNDLNPAEEGRELGEKEQTVPGVLVSKHLEKDGDANYEVGWAEGDPENPMNWSRAKKWWVTTVVCMIAMAVSIPASIDGPVSDQFNEHYHVGAIAGSMTTGMAGLNHFYKFLKTN